MEAEIVELLDDILFRLNTIFIVVCALLGALIAIIVIKKQHDEY